MRIHTLLLALPIAFLLAATPQKPGEKPVDPAADKPAAIVVPPQFLSPIENVVRQLAKGGREREVKDLIDALTKLGYPKPSIDKLQKSAKDDLARAKTAIDALPAGAKQLRTTTAQLVAIMDKAEDGEAKEDMARAILMLDGECEAAHKVLGHEKVGSTWVRSEFTEFRKRRGEILAKIQEAKKLEVDMQVGEVDDELIQQACGVKATEIVRGEFILHTNFSVERSQRIMREVSRACALSNWLLKGKLELPIHREKQQRITWVMIDSREKFKKLASDLLAAGKLTPDSEKMFQNPDSEVGSYNLKDGRHVSLAQWESSTMAALLTDMARLPQGVQTALTAGHLNWLTLTCFGCTLPNFVFKDELRRGRGDTRVETEEDKRLREELLRLAKAGIAGSRTWMRYLVEHGEDPPFRNSFVPALGMISGNDSHKCTSVVDFLQEAGMLASLRRKLTSGNMDNPVESYNTALSTIPPGWTLGEMETKWRQWILGDRAGVAERIDKENLNAWPPDALAVLEYMNDIREKAFKASKIEGVWKLKFDPDLSEQCALHAKYLQLHPEQQKWPDAHEEYADKEGYTPEGAWAGGHSVILFGGTGKFEEAVDTWMGSFYHRLPLIDPGVLRLGWGKEELNTVMDMSSLAAPYEKPYVVVYPYDGQRDVPVMFQGNEFPDPVPDPNVEPGMVIEQEIFGYPITIQTNESNELGEAIDIDMKLFEGSSKDKGEVECYLSSPSNPTNPELAPRGVWCLIPKEHLNAKTEYKVVATWKSAGKGAQTSAGKHMEWTFRTK